MNSQTVLRLAWKPVISTMENITHSMEYSTYFEINSCHVLFDLKNFGDQM